MTKSAHNLLRKPRDTSTDSTSSFISGGQFHIGDATGAAATSARTRPAKPAKRAKVQMTSDRSASAKRLYVHLGPTFKEQVAHTRNAAFEEAKRESSNAPESVERTILSAGVEAAIQRASNEGEVVDGIMSGNGMRKGGVGGAGAIAVKSPPSDDRPSPETPAFNTPSERVPGNPPAMTYQPKP